MTSGNQLNYLSPNLTWPTQLAKPSHHTPTQPTPSSRNNDFGECWGKRPDLPQGYSIYCYANVLIEHTDTIVDWEL